jgi:nitrogen fixation protein
MTTKPQAKVSVPEKTRKVKLRINDALMSAMGWKNGSEFPRVGVEARRTKPGARSVLVMWPVPRGKGYAFQREKGGWRIDLSRFGDYAMCPVTIVAHRIVGDQLHVETPAHLRTIGGTPVNQPPEDEQEAPEHDPFKAVVARPIDLLVEEAAKELCRQWPKDPDGCAAICMDRLGDIPRDGCRHAFAVHGTRVRCVLKHALQRAADRL